MEKLQILQKQYDDILDICLEQDSILYANKSNIEHYNQVILARDNLSRVKNITHKSLVKSCILIFGLLCLYIIKIIPVLGLIINLSCILSGIVFTKEILLELKKYINYNKKYKSVIKRYEHLSIEELKERILEIENRSKDIQNQLNTNRIILNYLKEEIVKENIKIDEIKKKLPLMEENIEQDYVPIYVDKKYIPKVKLKRRDEKCYKNQKVPMM